MMNKRRIDGSIPEIITCYFCAKSVDRGLDKAQINKSGKIICKDCQILFVSTPGKQSRVFSSLLLFKALIIARASIALIFMVVIVKEAYLNEGDGVFAIKSEIAHLREKFPSQSNDSWKWIASALNATGDQPKTLLLLYGPDDASTCDCLKRELADVHGRRTRTRDGYVAFNVTDAADYGSALERYRPLIKKPGVLAVDINLVSARMAMVFHFLGDEMGPEGNPALLIYTLRDAAGPGIRRAFGRAETSVREAWKDLPENEIAPLISRVVKNVVLVQPEKGKNDCAA